MWRYALLNGVSDLTCGSMLYLVGVSNLTCGSMLKIDGASYLTCGSMLYLVGVRNLTCGSMLKIDGASNLTCGGICIFKWNIESKSIYNCTIIFIIGHFELKYQDGKFVVAPLSMSAC